MSIVSGSETLERQPGLDGGGVTPELAESLPLDELKARLRREAASADHGVDTEAGRGDGDTLPEPPDAGVSGGAERQTSGEAATESEDNTPEGLQRQLASLRGNLKQLSDERKQLLDQQQEYANYVRQQQETAAKGALEYQNQAVEAEISKLPAERQQLAREYYRVLQQQNQAAQYQQAVQTEAAQRAMEIQQAELRVAKQQAPGLLEEIVRFSGERHGRVADDALEYIRSPQAQAFIAGTQTPEAFTMAIAQLSEVADFLNQRSAAAGSQERDARRATAGAPTRDVPNTPGTTAGGESDAVQRIRNMSSEDFEAFRQQSLREGRLALA